MKYVYSIVIKLQTNYVIFQYNCFGDLQKFFLITILIAIILTETLRLYLGYQGNLRDKVN